MNGIEEAIVSRAEDLVVLIAAGEDLSAAFLHLTQEEKEQVEHAEVIARRFLRWNLEEPISDIRLHVQTLLRP